VLDDGLDDDGWDEPGPLLPPEDRLWRHPSEIGRALRQRSSLREPRLLTVALLGGLVGALLTSGLFFLLLDPNAEPRTALESIATPSPPLRRSEGAIDVARVAERAAPGVVQVTAVSAAGTSTGSGVVIRSDGVIVTNAHVVAGARSIDVTFADGSTLPARLRGADPDTDVAALTVATDGVEVATLGTATLLKVGHPAVAVGASSGMSGSTSATSGVVSALGTHVKTRGGVVLYDLIQIDAPLLPGTTGGPLVDDTGSVIGVTTSFPENPTGSVGYAVPIDIARLVAESLVQTGSIVRVWLGIEGHEVDITTARARDIDGGVIVRRVVAKSPADTGGLAAGDVIVAVDGRPTTTMTALVVMLRTRQPGDDVELSLRRGTEQVTVAVELLERPRDVTGNRR
jgi:S1-C subfamily serine protease